MSDQISPAQLKTQVMAGAEETKRYLGELKKKVSEFDEKADASTEQPASKYLEDALLNAHKTIDQLEEAGHQLAGEPSDKSAKDQAMAMVESGLQSSRDAMHAIESRAVEYDAKYLGSRGSKAAGAVSDTVHDVVNTGRQRAMEAMEKANDVLQSIRQTTQQAAGQAKLSAQVVTGEAAKLVEKGDEMLGASDKAGGVVQGVKKLDERMQVTVTATKIDAKVTGGLGKMVVDKSMEIVQESVEYITETLNQAKLAASKADTAQAVETKAGSMAESASATAEHGKEMAQDTVESAKDKTSEAVGMAQDKAMQAKDTTMEQVGSAVDTVRENAPDVSGRMEQGTSKTSEMAGQAMGKGGEVVDMAKETGSHAVDQATETGSQVVGQAKDAGSQAVDKAQEQGSQAVGTGKQAKDSVKQTGQQAKESAKETGQQAKESAAQTGQQAKEKAQQMTPGGSSGQSEEGGSGSVDMVGSKTKEAASKAREAVTPSSSSATSTTKKGDAASGGTKEVGAKAYIS